MIQKQLPLFPEIPPESGEPAYFVGQYLHIFEFCRQSLGSNLGVLLLAYPSFGLGTMLRAVYRDISAEHRSVLFQCYPETLDFSQITSLTKKVAPAWSPVAKTREFYAGHLEVCIEKLIDDEISYLFVNRADHARPLTANFLADILRGCEQRKHKVTCMFSQLVTDEADQIVFQEHKGRLPMTVTLPEMDFGEVCQFVSEFCPGAERLKSAIERGDTEFLKAMTEVYNHSRGRIAGVIEWVNVKKAVVPSLPLDASVIEICLEFLRRPHEAFALLAKLNVPAWTQPS